MRGEVPLLPRSTHAPGHRTPCAATHRRRGTYPRSDKRGTVPRKADAFCETWTREKFMLLEISNKG